MKPEGGPRGVSSTETFELSALDPIRDRVGALVARHDQLLRPFWREDAEHGTFGLSPSSAVDDNVTTACTCALSFIDANEKLPTFLELGRTKFLNWLLATTWSSEDLGEHNVYTAPMALAVVNCFDPEQLTHPRPRGAIRFLIDRLSTSASGGLCFGEYPPSGFLTYWAVRSLNDVMRIRSAEGREDEERRTKIALDRAVEWSELELYRHLTYFHMRDLDRFDALQLGYCLATVDLARYRRGEAPNPALIQTALAALFEAQDPNGLWPKGTPIFHYRQRGSVYPFAFETLTAVMRVGADPLDPHGSRRSALDLFIPHTKALSRMLNWAEINEIRGSVAAGWRSNAVLPGNEPHAWATAMVLSFVSGFSTLLQKIAQTSILRELHATEISSAEPRKAEDVKSSEWTDRWDSQVLIGGEKIGLNKIIGERILYPHLVAPTESTQGSVPEKVWGVILFGPPGTAKTSTARDIAKALSWPFVTIETADFLAQGADLMALQARAIFRKLEQLKNVVVLIDEVEEFVRDRDPNKTPERESRLVTTAMLTLLQGLRNREGVLIILATNHVEGFDAAIMRPGRFDLILLVGPPSFEAKIEALRNGLRTQAGPAELAKDAKDYLDKRRSLVERLTYAEWRSMIRSMGRGELTGTIEVAHLAQELPSEHEMTITRDEWEKSMRQASRLE